MEVRIIKFNNRISCLYVGHEGIRRVEVELHSFLTSVLAKAQWLSSRSDHFTPRKDS